MAVHQETGARKVRDSLRMSTVKPAGSQGRCRRVRSLLWLACSDSGLPKLPLLMNLGQLKLETEWAYAMADLASDSVSVMRMLS